MSFKGKCDFCLDKDVNIRRYPGGDLCDNCVGEWFNSLADAAPETSREDLGYLAAQAIQRAGTEEDLIKLIDQRERQLVERNENYTEDQLAYFRKVRQEPAPEDLSIGRAMRFITNKVSNKLQARPEGVSLDFVSGLFWRTYRLIVREETGIDLKSDTVKKDPDLASAMRNLVHWIMRSDKADWSPDKSLYLWGDLGVGKSTLARAASAVLAYLYTSHGWDDAKFNFVSMDQLFLEVYTTENLESIRSMGKGNLIIDELKEDHARYRHFGNDFPILEIILLSRHELWKKGRRTIITTNIAPRDLKNYLQNERLRSRMGQEYQNVQIKGSNKRKPAERLKN